MKTNAALLAEFNSEIGIRLQALCLLPGASGFILRAVVAVDAWVERAQALFGSLDLSACPPCPDSPLSSA